MPVDPVILSAKFRDPRRVKRRFVPQQDIHRRAAEAMRAFREDAIDRPQRVRSVSSGPATAHISLPRNALRDGRNLTLNFEKIEVKMPVDPAVLAAHEQAQAQEAQKRANEAELAQLPGIRGYFLRAQAKISRHAGKVFLGLLILVDRLNLGVNLNSFGSALVAFARWLKP